jgi:hypothetical protein
LKSFHVRVFRNVMGDFEPLRSFCERLKPKNDRHQVHMLELSVFDSGIGYAERWKGRPLD